MVKSIRWVIVAVGSALGSGGALVACATGGANSGDDTDDTGKMDAAVGARMDGSMVTIDAPSMKLDGGVMPDAPTPPPDAPPGSLFCTSNAQCTNAGECCLTFGQPMGFCAPGTIVLGSCVPIT